MAPSDGGSSLPDSFPDHSPLFSAPGRHLPNLSTALQTQPPPASSVDHRRPRHRLPASSLPAVCISCRGEPENIVNKKQVPSFPVKILPQLLTYCIKPKVPGLGVLWVLDSAWLPAWQVNRALGSAFGPPAPRPSRARTRGCCLARDAFLLPFP